MTKVDSFAEPDFTRNREMTLLWIFFHHQARGSPFDDPLSHLHSIGLINHK